MGGGGGGGGGWNPVADISKGYNNLDNWVGDRIGGNVGQGVKSVMQLGQGGIGDDRPQPQAPGVDPGLSSTLQSQQQQAKDFRANIGTNEGLASENLGQATNKQLSSNLQGVNRSDNSRGLLYGGINQGNQQQQRSNAATSLAQGRVNINDQYQNAANQMDAAAVSTGQMVQQSQQAVQDQIYNQALTNMMNRNNAFGSVLGAGMMAAAMA